MFRDSDFEIRIPDPFQIKNALWNLLLRGLHAQAPNQASSPISLDKIIRITSEVPSTICNTLAPL